MRLVISYKLRSLALLFHLCLWNMHFLLWIFPAKYLQTQVRNITPEPAAPSLQRVCESMPGQYSPGLFLRPPHTHTHTSTQHNSALLSTLHFGWQSRSLWLNQGFPVGSVCSDPLGLGTRKGLHWLMWWHWPCSVPKLCVHVWADPPCVNAECAFMPSRGHPRGNHLHARGERASLYHGGWIN